VLAVWQLVDQFNQSYNAEYFSRLHQTNNYILLFTELAQNSFAPSL